MTATVSGKASAALSRRCLQHLLRHHDYNQRDLRSQLEAAQEKLPSSLAEVIDVVRGLGNVSAHPKTDGDSAIILDVEPGEAELLLELLEELFDEWYTKPAQRKARLAPIEAKLAAAKDVKGATASP